MEPGHDVVVFDVATGERLFQVRNAELATFVAHGTALLVTLDAAHTTVVLDPTSGATLRSLGTNVTVVDDIVFAANRTDATLLDVHTGARLMSIGKRGNGLSIQGTTAAWLEGGYARAFDLGAVRPIALADAETCPATRVVVHPGAHLVAALARNGDLCLWDVTSGSLRRVPWKGAPLKAPPGITGMAGTIARLAIGAEARLVDTTTNTFVTEAAWRAHESVAVSKDGQLGVGVDPRAVFEEATGKQLFTFQGERPAFSPDSRTLAFRGPRFGLETVDARSGTPLLRVLPRGLPLDSLTGTPDGLGLVGFAHLPPSAFVLDARTLVLARSLPGASLVSSSGLSLASAGTEVHVVESSEPSPPHASSLHGNVGRTGLSPDGRWLAAAIYDPTRPERSRSTFVVVSIAGGPAREVVSPTLSIPNALGVTVDGKLLVVEWPPSTQASVIAWDIDTGRRTVERRDAEHVRVLPVGHAAVLLGPDLRVIDLGSGQLGPNIKVGEPDPATAFALDGRVVAVGGWGKWATLVDLERGATRAFLQDSTDVQPGAFSSDGTLVYGWGPDGIGVWRASDGALLWTASPLGPATLLRGADGTLELVGDAHAGAEALSCAAGGRVLPFAACSVSMSPGVIARALAQPVRPVGR